VESSAEEREVLRTVLETRGLRIWEAEGAEEGLEIARQEHPDVIVLDLEAHWADGDGDLVQEQFEAASTDRPASLVILGKARRGNAAPTGHVVAKPYHFAPLVRTIEQLAAAKAA
jgi:CheY-like chemotaxis protein